MSIFTKYVPYPVARDVHVSSHTTTHEHRAPTDESVRLLGEMQNAARDSVLATLECRDNKFSCRAVLQEDWRNFQQVLIGDFTLNGEKHTFEYKVEIHRQDSPDARGKLAVKIRDELAAQIASQICISGLTDSWHWRTK